VSRRRGFTIIEMLAVMTIIGILVRIALPSLQAIRRKAEAAKVLGDFEAVRVAAYNYNADTGLWPPETGAGRVPQQLVTYLPQGFSFTKSDYQLDWDYWITARGTARYPATGILVGISVTTEDRLLGQAVQDLLAPKSEAAFVAGGKYTFMILPIGSSP
jgi:prepilin-type N-terminal cleavage/methylation domain-containing protein